MDPESYAILQVFLLTGRILVTVFCVARADKLNRSKFGWGLFGFFLPIIALIVILFMKPKVEFEDVKANSA